MMAKRLSASACRQDGFLPFDLACSQVNRHDRLTATKVMRRCSTSMTNWDLGVSVSKVWKFRCIQGKWMFLGAFTRTDVGDVPHCTFRTAILKPCTS